jgi:flagellar export protein FliJ
MKKSERLAVLVKIKEAKERDEARKFSEFQKVVQDKKKKLSDLEGYLEEYRGRFLEITRNGAAADKIRSCYAFISQLNTAIFQQKKTVRDAEDAVQEYRRNWIQAKQRMDILEKAISRFRDEELRYEKNKEQSFTDELTRYKRQDH